MKTQQTFAELAKKPLPELKKALTEERDRLWQLKSDLAAGKVKNVAEIQNVKRTIARILTAVGKTERNAPQLP